MAEQQVGEHSTPGWLELYTLSLHQDMEAALPKGLYIRGNVGPGQHFDPTSDIEGRPSAEPPSSGTQPGWLQLSNVSFHRDQEATTPIRPYIKGVLDNERKFYPQTSPTIER